MKSKLLRRSSSGSQNPINDVHFWKKLIFEATETAFFVLGTYTIFSGDILVALTLSVSKHHLNPFLCPYKGLFGGWPYPFIN